MPRVLQTAHLATLAGVVAMTIGALLAVSSPAAGGGAMSDGVPAGAVAYFSGACPLGWAPATVATGRMIVSVTDSAAVGRTVGAPLGDRENRLHTHRVSGTVTLPARTISAANGSNLQGAAASRAFTASGFATVAPSGLPFVQLRACTKR